MRNKIIMLVFGLLFFLVMFNTLYMMYIPVETNDFHHDTTNVEYASHWYLFISLFMSAFMLFFKDLTALLHKILIAMVTFFYVESWILTLIAFYSNPNNHVEVLAGAIFFMAGSLVLATLFFVHTLEEKKKERKLGNFHKVIRYILVFIVGVMILKSLLGILSLLEFLS